MSEANQDVAARRGRDAQRRSRKRKMLQERRQAGHDSDDEDDDDNDDNDDSTIEYDGREDCPEKKPVRIQEASHWVDSEAETAASEVGDSIDWEALAAEICMARIKKSVTDSSIVAAIGETDINHTSNRNGAANAKGLSQDHETGKNKIVGGKSGNGSSGSVYINAFKPINARWMPPKIGLRLFPTAINSLITYTLD
ncbi:uncharacterized protein GLRG_00333 [Colletotrichum graminicola M1.001]|uniref:Uncharacterized protein n=1 Tax=Colletotrichum graminicola (strain M1.001 / M2 / FGSC 10212) TaxID=645133 RepID=E3Q288_COLGM|nr:uncharacterized protein GLRG_00333 [Colletotrichum graminicola M1.001]EFQ25189.1 hypothetical protein GLRG_00333 [Colletotrichum graminicola M1.001]